MNMYSVLYPNRLHSEIDTLLADPNTEQTMPCNYF